MSIKQVTVFGGSGFIGQGIVRALAVDGYLVKVASRRAELAESLKKVGEAGQLVAIRADLIMPDSVAAAIAGSQAVVNAAGAFVETSRQNYRTVDALGAATVAEKARAAGTERLIHISSIGTEDSSSRTSFIQSKIAGEEAVVKSFENTTILRPSAVFGAGDTLFNAIANIACGSPFVPLVGSGATRLQPVHIDDVGRAAAAVLRHPTPIRGVFELAGPRIYTYRELVELTLRELDRKERIVSLPVGLMKVVGFLAQQLVRVGVRPPLTLAQVQLMTQDLVMQPGARGLADLGITPSTVEAILPSYIGRYRTGSGRDASAAA